MSVEDYEARDKALEIALLVPHGTLYSLDHRRCIERAICDEFQKYSREIATLKAELEAARKEIERLNIAMNRWSEMELIEDIDIDELEKSLPATMIVPTAHYKVVCNILINKIRQLAAERDDLRQQVIDLATRLKLIAIEAAEQAAERQRELENAIAILTKHNGWDAMMNDAEYQAVKEVKTKYAILVQDVKP